MTHDGHTIAGSQGTIRIGGEALAALVVTAAELTGARVRRPRRGLDVVVTDGRARIELELSAGYGVVLPELARRVQEGVAEALRSSAGLEAATVDVSIAELHR